MYTNVTLTTAMVCNNFGHGEPAAFLLASNNKTETLTFYLKMLRTCHPEITPEYFMLDRDQSMINALHIVYPLVFLSYVGGTFYMPGSSTSVQLLIRSSGRNSRYGSE